MMKGFSAGCQKLPSAFLPLASASRDKQVSQSSASTKGSDRVVEALSEEGPEMRSTEREDKAHVDNETAKLEDDKLQDQEDAEVAVVDALAYRIPCPADGGACWGPSGRLICFGRSMLSFETTSSASPDDEDDVGVGPPLEKQVPLTKVASGIPGTKAENPEGGPESSASRSGGSTEAPHKYHDDSRGGGSSQLSDVLMLGSDVAPARGGEDGILQGDAYRAPFGSEVTSNNARAGGPPTIPWWPTGYSLNREETVRAEH